MNQVSRNKIGLVFGGFFGLYHLAWSLLVAFGWAQPLMNFIFRLHSINPPYTITPFDLGRAVGLVVVASVIGYVSGWVVAAIWNRVHR